jgi:indole-3-glycerol phosphate synthase
MAFCRQSLEEEKLKFPLDELKKKSSRAKKLSLSRALKKPGISLIAEVKRSSPSKGVIRDTVDPASLALTYEHSGARAISVLTEPRFFSGSLKDLAAVKAATNLPVLRKDFIFDPYQLYQSSYWGADAILLIAACLDEIQVSKLISLAHQLQVEVLLEVHNLSELELALSSQADIIGINNRDLRSLKVNLSTSLELIKSIKDLSLSVAQPLISESGISNFSQVETLREAGFDGILIGTVLVKSDNPGKKLRELLGKPSASLASKTKLGRVNLQS